MPNMNDLIDAMVAANDAVAEAGDVARKARGVADVAQARVLDASHNAALARKACDEYARKHGCFQYHD